MKPATPCKGPVGITRRNMLQVGAISALNLSLPQLLQAGTIRSGKGPVPQADSCILVFLNGGPSHLDMWDMKPDLPREMRSEFSPIATSVPGIQLCEHLPRLAQQMHLGTLVRSVHHDQVAHAPAVYTALTGVKSNVRAGILGAKPTDHPAIGSVVGLRRSTVSSQLPYVLLPYLTAEGAGGPPQPGFLAGWLGPSRDPLLVRHSGTGDHFTMPALALGRDLPAQRVQDRKRLLDCLNTGGTPVGAAPARELTGLQARACDLLTSTAAQQAFQIDQEPLRVREAYGRNIYGQSLLLARRLVEAGTRLACISWAPNANATWDTHAGNFTKLKNELLPQLDRGLSALLSELVDGGLLARTLVVVMGEIGRTPKINPNAGRDHWEKCYTLLLAGGGIKGGYVHGASDKHGAYPSRQPVSAADIVATVYHALGIPADLEIRDRLNRPLAIVPDGAPVTELFA